MLVPIVLFVYNRPEHTRRTIEALQNNIDVAGSDLYVFSDGPKGVLDEKVLQVRKYIGKISGFRSVEILERNKNWGLSANIIDGVTQIVYRHERVIVLEDDILTSRHFVTFMNEGLRILEPDVRVKTISGYTDPYYYGKATAPFLTRKATSWGWGTWKRAWNEIEWDIGALLKKYETASQQRRLNILGNDYYAMLLQQKEGIIDSWAIRSYASFVYKEGFHLSPHIPLSINIGLDGSGIHCGKSDYYHYSEEQLSGARIDIRKENIMLNVKDEIARPIEDFSKEEKRGRNTEREGGLHKVKKALDCVLEKIMGTRQ